MIRISSLTLLALLLLGMVACQPKEDNLGKLKRAISKKFDSSSGSFAMAFYDLTSGDSIMINADEKFHAASTMKTPVMIEVFKQAANGTFSLSDSILVKHEFKSIVDSSSFELEVDSLNEPLLYPYLGKYRSIRDLTYDMIIVSSNLATNLIIEWVDAKNVTQTMKELGAPNMNVLRGVQDLKAFDKGLSNSATAYDLAVILKKLANLEVVSNQASQQMIDILFDQRYNEIIPFHLPEEVRVAHKTGAITGVHHDSGIVYLPDGRAYVLVLLSKEMPEFDKGTEMLAEVSKLVYDYMMESYD